MDQAPVPEAINDVNCRSATCRTSWSNSYTRSNIRWKFLSPTSRPHLPSIPSTCNNNNNQGRTVTIQAGVWPVIKRLGISFSVSNQINNNLLYFIEQGDGQVETAIEETSRQFPSTSTDESSQQISGPGHRGSFDGSREIQSCSRSDPLLP